MVKLYHGHYIDKQLKMKILNLYENNLQFEAIAVYHICVSNKYAFLMLT